MKNNTDKFAQSKSHLGDLGVRYNRNILIEGFGEEGQEKLKNAKILVIGAGGLGSPVLYYLAAAGIGTIGIVDFDVVDVSNLQRQILHQTKDMGEEKVKSAAEKLNALNPEVKIILYKEYFTAENAHELVSQYDFVVDCCDNFDTKFLINDVCIAERKPFSHGSVIALRGEVMTCLPGTADYRKVFDNPPPKEEQISSAQIGVLGAMAGLVGSIQATEVVKYFTGIGDLITNRILLIDGKTMSFQSFKV